jgi:hypothetical protein
MPLGKGGLGDGGARVDLGALLLDELGGWGGGKGGVFRWGWLLDFGCRQSVLAVQSGLFCQARALNPPTHPCTPFPPNPQSPPKPPTSAMSRLFLAASSSSSSFIWLLRT